MNNNDLFAKTIVGRAAALGYELTLTDENTLRHIRPMHRFTPELFGGKNELWGDKPWEIQTAGYGPLSPEDINKVVEGFRNAQSMVQNLTAWGF